MVKPGKEKGRRVIYLGRKIGVEKSAGTELKVQRKSPGGSG